MFIIEKKYRHKKIIYGKKVKLYFFYVQIYISLFYKGYIVDL